MVANFPKLPKWVENLIIKALSTYVDPDMVKGAIEEWKVEFGEWLKAQAALTTNKIDDKIADTVISALNGCDLDNMFLCDLIQRGEVALVTVLKGMAAKTDNEIDDAIVAIVAEALGVPA